VISTAFVRVQSSRGVSLFTRRTLPNMNLIITIAYKHDNFIHLMVLQPFVGPWLLLSFLILYTVGRTPWAGDQPAARPLPIHRTTQTQNSRTQTSMP
jgi:hypothetical protein